MPFQCDINCISTTLADYKTSNYLETNLASVDNSATPNIKHSQLRPLMERSLEPSQFTTREDLNSDWLGCIAKKTGLPRLLLSFTIFMSAVVMIWLCFTTAASAPEQRVPTQVNNFCFYLQQNQFLPEASFGHRVLSLPACVCVRVCVNQSLACPRDNSGSVQARITNFGPKMPKTLVKVPIVFGVNWLWLSRSNLT